MNQAGAIRSTRSLKSRLLLPLLLAGVAIAALAIWGIQRKERQQMEAQLQQRGELIAHLVNYAAESVSRTGELQRIVAAIGADPDVIDIVVAGGEPTRVLASTRPGWFGKLLTDLPGAEFGDDLRQAIRTHASHHHFNAAENLFGFSAPLLLSQQDLTGGERSAGAVMVHMDTRPMLTDIGKSARELSVIFLAGLLFLGMLGYGLVSRRVLRPLAAIGAAVSAGPGASRKTWESATTDDELGALAHTLRDALARTDAALTNLKSDIDLRKRVEEELRESQQRLALAKDSADIGIWDWAVVGGKLSWDARMFELYGISEPEFSGAYDAWQKGLHPEDRKRGEDAVHAAIEGIKDFQIEFRVVWPSGEVRHIEANALVLRAGDGSPTRMIGINRDITARKQSEAELAEAYRELIKTSRMAGMAEVATSVLHNVGNVLNSVNISANLLADRVRKTPVAELGRVVGLLHEQGANLGAFFTSDPRGPKVPEFLAQLADRFTRQQAAQLQEVAALQKNVEHIKEIVAMQQSYATVTGLSESISPAELIEDALRMNDGSFQKHEIELVREVAADLPLICVDKHKVLQILVNFLRNARHACEEAGHPGKRITVRATGDRSRVRITIADNGVGIPPENLKRIGNHGFTTKTTGHGFGLHSAANTAREMGGNVIAESDGPGRGAAFILELPAGSCREARSSDLPHPRPGRNAATEISNQILPV